MPSLFHHEKLKQTYSERTDEELRDYASELTEMKFKTEIPRQKQQIERILGHIVFELSYRMGMYNNDIDDAINH